MILFSHEFKWFDTVFSYSKESTDRHGAPGPGTDRSEIFKNLLVLVLFGPRFLKIFWSWPSSVRDFQELFAPGPAWSGLVPNFSFFSVLVRDRSVLVRGSLVTIEDSTESSENFIRIFVFTYVQNRTTGTINS